ncbi:MAG: prepilin-type N-terminal cleavage/methylation domain-containing protein [Candidatus Doudnabacteria bacterium]|nr:prepilin-type N-terminal cleavage/methylation domain-containing protein [Candidatus Doudnabacteria bacterium]
MKIKAFSLSELLIALLILGVIATFTIPKVITSSQSNQKKAAAKEVASMISGAYAAYQMDNSVSSSFSGKVLTPYMNYVSLWTANQQIDGAITEGARTCTNGEPCVKLHNGGAVFFYNATFNGTTNLNATYYVFDPDGAYSGVTTGTGKGIEFGLYYNGRISTWGAYATGTTSSYGASSICPSCDPTWFGWN